MKFHSLLTEMDHFSENIGQGQKFNIVMKNHHLYKNSKCWWNSSLEWKFISLTKMHPFDDNPSSWWKFIKVMKIQVDEDSSLW